MTISNKLTGKVVMLNSLSPLNREQHSNLSNLLTQYWPGARVDVIYQSVMNGYKHTINITDIIIFETVEDAIIFKLKYGEQYV
jgi:hypothetical protein